jgi:hypothetical protein
MCLKSRNAVGSILALLVAAVPISSAHSETTYVHAGDLNRLCTADSDINKSWCEGFISGELEIISNAPVQGIAACVPPLTTLPKGVAIAKKWLVDHPEKSALAASLAVAQALSEAFPCKK